jgi:site-specific recombinase XerD
MDRHQVAPGIHRDRYGFDVRVKAQGHAQTKRFPAETDVLVMQRWQAHTRAELLDRAADAAGPSRRGTLAEAVPRYLNQIAGRVSFKADRSHLAAWVLRYGALQLTRLTTEHVNLAIAQWQTAGVADKTVLHRCRVLRELYQTLHGKTSRHPVTDAKKPKTPHPHPVDVPIAVIQRVGKRLKARHLPQDYARYRVLTTTGQRAGQLMAAKPADVQLRKRIWIVRSAKNEPAHTVYLNADQLAAWRLFIMANAWGPYDTTKHARLLRACGWPAGIRPYNVRHALAMDALERGADLGDVQGLLGHTRIDTTRRYYAPFQAARQKRVSELLTGRFGR